MKPTIYYSDDIGICTKDTPGCCQYVRADIMWWHRVENVLPRVEGLSSGWVEVYADRMPFPVVACYDGGSWLDTTLRVLNFEPSYWRPIVYPSGYVTCMSRDRKK